MYDIWGLTRRTGESDGQPAVANNGATVICSCTFSLSFTMLDRCDTMARIVLPTWCSFRSAQRA